MQMVAAVAGGLLHGETPGHNLARRGAQRRQIRLAAFFPVVKYREWLTVHADGDGILRHPDLRRLLTEALERVKSGSVAGKVVLTI